MPRLYVTANVIARLSTSITVFFIDPATTEIYTLSLHDALPIFGITLTRSSHVVFAELDWVPGNRSEEHTSELQSRPHIVCRLLLEKKKNPCQMRSTARACDYGSGPAS